MIFSESAGSKSEKIEQVYLTPETDTFTTLVHSLKSSARTIGAVSLSELAKHLEAAGKRGDLETILRDTPKLLADYRKLETQLKLAMEHFRQD